MRGLASAKSRLFLLARIRDYRNQERIKVEFDPTTTTWFAVRNLLDRARSKGKDGPVSQYLVGAKLQQRFPTLEVSNDRHSTADVQTGRPGDFLIGDTAIHVTVRPMDGVYKKCLANIQQGYRPLILVPHELAEPTRIIADQWARTRIAVSSIESFVSQNIDELSAFDARLVREEFGALLRLYNKRVDDAELDKSVMIELPANL